MALKRIVCAFVAYRVIKDTIGACLERTNDQRQRVSIFDAERD